MKLISVVTPCYNEEENVRDVYQQVKDVFADIGFKAAKIEYVQPARKRGLLRITSIPCTTPLCLALPTTLRYP